MDRHSSQHLFSRRRVLLPPNSSLGGSIGLFSVLVIFQGESFLYIVLLIFVYFICYCLKRIGSEGGAEETTTTTNYAQYSDTPSSFDVERQATPRSPGPQQKYPKACPTCGGQLDEAILKQLIISGKVNCTKCGNLIQIK